MVLMGTNTPVGVLALDEAGAAELGLGRIESIEKSVNFDSDDDAVVVVGAGVVRFVVTFGTGKLFATTGG